MGLVGAVGLLLLGLWLAIRRGRTSLALFLGAFSTSWGLQILTIRVATLNVNGPADVLLSGISQAFLFPLYLLLAHFVAAYPPRLRVADRWWWPLVLSLPALAAGIVVLSDAGAGVDGSRGIAWGWASILLLFLPLVLAQTFALVRFSAGFARGLDGEERSRHRLPALVLLAYMSYLIPASLFGTSKFLPDVLGPGGLYVYEGTFAVVQLATWGCALWGWRAEDSRYRPAWAAAVTIPFLLAFVANDRTNQGLQGLWRILLVLGLFYSVVKLDFLELDLRLRMKVQRYLPWMLGPVAWGAASIALGQDGLPSLPWLVAGCGLTLLLGMISRRPIEKLLEQQFPYLQGTEEYLLRRRLEVYRTALQRNMAETDRMALAAKLGLSARDIRLIAGPAAPPGVPPRYHVESPLAEGTFGRVLLAQDRHVGERVVLKEYLGLAGGGAEFAREAKLMGELDHPNILSIRDVFRAGEDLFVVTAFAEGGSLEDQLQARGPYAPAKALEVLAEMLEGLAHVHRHGLVHRDVKPANILFLKGKVKLADFGAAFDPALEGALRGLRGQPGTLTTMAPEQARGEGASAASDTYAAGAVLYRMLTAQHYIPFAGLDEAGMRRAIVARPPRLPVAASPEINKLLAKSLAKDPGQRFPDAAAMLREVRRVRARLPRDGAAPAPASVQASEVPTSAALSAHSPETPLPEGAAPNVSRTLGDDL